MTPEERLMEEIKKQIPGGEYCEYETKKDCYFYERGWCILFNHPPLISHFDANTEMFRLSFCLELKPIKENNHDRSSD